jgi:hypothetical protein
VSESDLDFATKGHSHLDPTISTIQIVFPPLEGAQLSQLDSWLQAVLWESVLPQSSTVAAKSFEIHRTKGRIHLNDDSTILLQGVREVFELLEERDITAAGVTSAPRPSSKIVLIGRGLDTAAFTESFFAVVGIRDKGGVYDTDSQIH